MGLSPRARAALGRPPAVVWPKPIGEIRRLRDVGRLTPDEAHEQILRWVDTWVGTLREIRELPELDRAPE